MKQTLKCMTILLAIPGYSHLYAQEQLLASADQTVQTNSIEYSAYSFSHLGSMVNDQENNLSHFNYNNNDKHLHIGPIMAGSGLLLGMLGIIGMSQVNGVDHNQVFQPVSIII